MAIEKHLERQGPVSFSADGGSDGLVTVSSVECFKVKQKVVISATGEPDLPLQIKRVISFTQLIVGPLRTPKDKGVRSINNLKAREDISAYTVAKLASIVAAEQPKIMIPERDIIQAVYEFEPTVAVRTMGVDKVGNAWSVTNPLPISGSFGVSSPTRQDIQNISTPVTANTEFTISLPNTTKRYFLRVRGNKAKGRIAVGAGETATKYWELTRGTIFDSENMNLPTTSKVYMQVPKPSLVVEVIALVLV